MAHYNGSKLLSLKDARGLTPAIYLASGNRSTGKTTYFNRMLVNNFKKRGQQFNIYYRYKRELSDVDEKFFGEISRLFFMKDTMRCIGSRDDPYKTLLLNNSVCGYAVALNSSEDIKKCSHVFGLVENTLFDEFQSENNHYLTDEIKSYISIGRSVARGNGKQVRYVRNILCGNHISMLNPYYSSMGITDKLRSDTKFLRGRGWVCQIDFDPEVAKMTSESSFDVAFENETYVQQNHDLVYLNDNLSMIKKRSGKARYIGTLYTSDKMYGVYVNEQNEYHVSKQYDKSHPIAIASTKTPLFDRKIRSESVYLNLRKQFDYGAVYFDDLEVKNNAIKTLSY